MNESRLELDEDEAVVWYAFRDLVRDLHSALNRRLMHDAGLSAADYALLEPLSGSDVLRARELGRIVGWERSRLSHQITRMEERGLVRREVCEHDARGHMVRLTRVGRKALEAASPAYAETVRKYFFDPLTDREQETVGLLLSKMLAVLDDDTD